MGTPNEIGSHTPDELFAGDFPVIRQTITIEDGQDLKRGAALAQKTNGKWVLVEVGGADGSDQPKAILAGDIFADGADAQATVYRTGYFNREAIIFKVGDDPAAFITEFETLQIWMTEPMPDPVY